MTAHILRPAGVDGGRTHCRCGQPWPCPHSAEGRWAALRDYLEACLRGCRHDAAVVKGSPTENWIDAKGDAYDSALRRMAELEAGR